MSKRIAIAVEIFFAVVFLLLSITGTFESFIYQFGGVTLHSAFWIYISYICMQKFEHKYSYFIPSALILVISFPTLIILMVVSGGWAILGYGIIFGLILISLLFIMPFYWILKTP